MDEFENTGELRKVFSGEIDLSSENEKSTLMVDEKDILRMADAIRQNRIEDQIFAINLDRFLDNGARSSEYIYVCKTSNALAISGADKELDVVIAPRTIAKCMADPEIRYHGHGLTRDILQRIPEELRNPVMIFKGNKDSSLVVITRLKDNKSRGVMVAISLNEMGKRNEVNRISSVYGKDNINNYIRNQMEYGNLIAVNKKEAKIMLQSAGLQLPLEETYLNFNDSIAYTIQNVKGFEEKINERRKNVMEETKFPIKEYDDRGNLTYYESITGFWEKWEYDKNDNLTYWENCYGDGCKSEYDDSGNLIYSEDVYGNWWKYGYDDNGNKTFYENGFGYWEKWEYDKYGCLTYRENSDGYKFGASREEREAEIIEKNNDESDDSEITDSILEQNLSEVQEDNKSYNIDELFDSQGKYIGRPTKKAILAKTEKSIWLSTNWIYPDKQECNMKKFLIETNEDRMMAFVDDKERAFVLKIDAELTLETLINADYSKFDGCKTAEDCARVMGKSKKQHIVDFEKLLTDAKVCTIFSKYGNWEKREYDNKVGKETYYEDSIGLWFKYEYDKDGNETYYENSFGKKRGTPKKIQNDSDDSEIVIEKDSTHRGRK